MKIALVVPGGVGRDGRTHVIPALLWLIDRLARRHTVQVFALQQYAERCTYPLLGATVHNLAYRQHASSPLRWPGFVRTMQAQGPFDVLHAFWAAPPGLLAGIAGRVLRTPTLVSIGGGELVALRDIGYGGQLGWRSRLSTQLALRLAHGLTAGSGFLQRQAACMGFQAEMIPLGVDGACFIQPAHAPTATNTFRLLHVASLNKVKDQATLLRAMQRVVAAEPNVHLDVVGEDTLNGRVQQHCTELGLQAYVTFHGWQSTDQVRAFLAQADLFVLTSRHESQCVAVCEAAAAGLPTVGTAVGLVADWAPQQAVAVPVGDDAALAAGILQLLHDPAQRAAFGLAAQRWARAHDADWTAQQFEQHYERLASKPTP